MRLLVDEPDGALKTPCYCQASSGLRTRCHWIAVLFSILPMAPFLLVTLNEYLQITGMLG